MNAFFAHWMVHSLGWTLLHFCWEGAAVALLLWCCLRLMDGVGSRVRYGVACGALVLMAALPLATFGYLAAERSVQGPAVEVAGMTVNAVVSDHIPLSEKIRADLDRAVPWVLGVWLVGAVFFLVRLQDGLVVARRMRWMATSVVPAELSAMFGQMRVRMGVRRPVALLHSALVQVPTVVGWLRPVVLVPVSCFTGLSGAQVEAILCHELAHVLRHDYLVSVAQSVVEALLFYHPAVWWISKQVRRERECCCDELAIEVGGDALGYARALQYLEARRSFYPEVALGANGGVLTMRIKRLLGTRESSAASQMVAMAVLTMVIGVAAASLGKVAEAKMAEAPVAGTPVAIETTASVRTLPMVHALVRAGKTAALMQTVANTGAGAGSLGGTVVDGTGAVIRNAKVTVTNTATGVQSTKMTNDMGGYAVSGLEPGAYTIEASATGFQTLLGNVRVDAMQGANLNLKLDVGSTTTVVDVVGEGVARGGGAAPTVRNLAEWMNRHSDLSPEQQQRALAAETGFSQLSPQTQQRLQDQLRSLNTVRASVELPKDVLGGGQVGGRPQRVSGGVMAGQLVSRPNPVYPQEAKEAGVQGAVVLRAIISKEGTIENLQVVSGPKELAGSAIDAVKQWVYKPYLLNGEPTEVDTTITVNYQLGDVKPWAGAGRVAPQDSGASRAESVWLQGADGPQRVAGGVMAGQLVSKVDPVYPAEAKAKKIQGSVVLRAVITKEGKVRGLELMSMPSELDHSAIDAVRQWVYKPYLLNGEPTEVQTMITVNYMIGGMASAEPKKIGNGVSAPVPVSMPDPEYTEAARKAKVSGNVQVSFWVDEKGDPTHVQVTKGLRADLDQKAIEAVSKYKFTPAMERGKPVTVAMNVEVNFQIF